MMVSNLRENLIPA